MLTSQPTSPLAQQPVQGPGLINAFVCHCADCHKITASQFATNFTADEGHVRHLRGRDNLRVYSQSATIATGNTMANHFCATCGTLMYRVSSGAPRSLILRVGTVDDFALQDVLLGPRAEQFTKDRRAWVPDMRAPPVAARHEEGNPTPDYFSKSTM